MNDSVNLRRHRNACPYYREDWSVADALYRSICLRGAPPLTEEEEKRCLSSRRACWREMAPCPALRVGTLASLAHHAPPRPYQARNGPPASGGHPS